MTLNVTRAKKKTKIDSEPMASQQGARPTRITVTDWVKSLDEKKNPGQPSRGEGEDSRKRGKVTRREKHESWRS